MVGSLIHYMTVGLLAATPTGGFTFEGVQASARTTSPAGFFAQGTTPYPSIYERGLGSATLTAEDRVPAWGATYGDKARVEAEFRMGQIQYRVELTQPGFPPVEASGGAVARPSAPRPGFPVGGGVILDRDLNGNSGLGWPATTRMHAAVSVWGVGSVWRNGQLLTDSAVIQAAALSHGAHADDDTHQILAVAREGDAELDVLVWNLPLNAEPRGFIQFSFDDVEIEVNDQPVKAVAAVPNVAGLESGGVMTTFGGFGQNGSFVSPTPHPAPGEGVGGAGFDVTAQPQTGIPGGPVTPASPGVLGGPLSPDPFSVLGGSVGTEATQQGTAAPGIPGVPAEPTTGPAAPVGPGAVTPDTISGTFPTTGAPTPPANISGSMPGTPAPGAPFAEEQTVPTGAPPPGGPAESGVAIGSAPPTLPTTGNFTVPISPPNFGNFAGTGQVSPGIIATAPPIGTDPTIPTPPLLGSPAPLTAAPGAPLLGTPAPLTAAPPPALITTPAPANVTPGASTLTPVTPTAPAPGAPPVPSGGTGVPPSI
ncbi:elastin [Hyalangium sp.]|uniref:elastin n=1 Tax=Hyalangium sp. TaxID=2028555 RepID=UPI002D38FF05|nr:elastin [Hyalangium sp.]HYH99259.1 elastin [Hyalangium sp.]